jgi:hypothetical protein
MALVARDPNELQRGVMNGKALIRESKPGLDTGAEERAFEAALTKQAFLSRLEAGDEADAQEFLNGLRGDGGLSPKDLIVMQRMMDQTGSQRLKSEEDALKTRGREAGRQLIDRYCGVNGQSLSLDDVEAVRDLLSPDDYGKWVQRVNEGLPPPGSSNPEDLVRLTRMAINGEAAFMDTADEFLKGGSLTLSDYRTAVNESRQFRNPVIKEVMTEIKIRTGYSEMNPNPDAAASYIQAKRDYLEWLDSGPGQQASDDAKQKMGTRIANNYRLVQVESLLTAPAPLYLVGSRTRPDIEATKLETNAAFDAGLITEERYFEEGRRIKRLDEILTRQQEEEEAARERSDRR